MHSYQLGFHILLFSIIGLLYQAHGHENDEANTGYEGLSEQDMNDMGMDPGLIAGIMKARAEAGQGQSDAQGQQANNSPPPSAPRSPVTGPTVIQSAPSRPTVTQQQNEDNWFGHDETNWNDHNDHNNGTHVPAGSSSPVYRENWDNHDDVNWFAGNDDHNNGIHAPGLGGSSFPAHGDDDDDFQENLQRAFRESEQDFQSKNNAIYEENLRRALADSTQAIQSNNDHDFQSVIEASLALEEEKQIQLARTLSMGHSRNNYDNGVGSDNEDIETQQALIQSFSVQSNQRRNNRVSNPQDSDAEQYYGEASSSTNANVIKPKKKNGNKKTKAERSLLSSSPSPSTQRLTRSRTTTKVKEEPSTSAGSLRRSKTKKETRKEKEESSSAGSSSRSKTKKDDTTKEKGKNPLQKITKSLSSLKKIFQR